MRFRIPKHEKGKPHPGKHVDRAGNKYGPGDVIETSEDLVAKYGPAKFERLPDVEELEEIQAKRAAKAKAAQEAKGKADGEAQGKTEPDKAPARGTNVSEKFPKAKAEGFQVFARGKEHYVYEGEKGKAINDKPLKAEDVESFVESWLKE